MINTPLLITRAVNLSHPVPRWIQDIAYTPAYQKMPLPKLPLGNRQRGLRGAKLLIQRIFGAFPRKAEKFPTP